MRRLTAVLAALALSLVMGGCAATDVVGKNAVESFVPIAVLSTERISYEDGVWILASSMGDEFRFSVDPTRPSKGDVEFSFDSAPFLAAGLDAEKLSMSAKVSTSAKLPSEGEVAYSVVEGRLLLRFELGAKTFAIESTESIQEGIAELVRTQRDRIGYHAALDHYGIKLGGGHMFEWAKDATKNDKDIVWVLNPDPFVAAGVDPAKVDGWVYAPVEMMEKGKKVQVDRLLKPFDLN